MRTTPNPLLLALLAALSLAGCSPTGGAAAGPALWAAGAASLAAVPVLGRTLPDAVYSTATGEDCSAVRLEQGKSYCRPTEPPWEAQPVCTRSLGVVDCWANPEVFGTKLTSVADAPKPTAEQEAYRTRSWPIW
jgi:hypothetical protein